MKGPHFVQNSTFTHYSYLSCPVGVSREPTGLYALTSMDEKERRVFIHNMMRNGELIASLPFDNIRNMKQLRGALEWIHKNRGTN